MGPSDLPSVGFIGLGAMGFAMSTHLVRVGFPVTGYDIYTPTVERWQSTCKEIPASKATVASSPAEAVASSDVVLLMVANHYHIHSALFDEKTGAVHGLPKDCTVVINATIPPTQPAEIRRRLTKEFGRGDIKLVDCPVSGGVARSTNGTLTMMLAADDDADFKQPHVEQVLQNLSTLGKTLYPIPGRLGSGQSAKALNQVMCGIHIVSASEIMGLAATLGADTKAFFDYLTSPDDSQASKRVVGWTWMLENRGPRMLTNTPPLASATLIIDKDVGIIREEENRLGVELPLLNRANDILKEVMKTDAKADDSIIVQHYLGKNSPNQNLVVDNIGKKSESQPDLEKILATCNAIIHLNSAFETVKFSEALELTSPEQRKQWFSIIAGAAGGSTIFSDVIPRVFADKDGTGAGFKTYAKEKYGDNVLKQAVSFVSRPLYDSD
jgi:3-hydroxyisobutyrate dehydrogenase-like beta-hydroxyacid dehydrogenase